MKFITSTIALAITAMVSLTGCCCWNNDCEPGCAPPCPEQRPHCCPKPHIWDRECCDPSNYEY